MRVLMNILWFWLFGWLIALVYLICGIVFCCTLFTIPLGIRCIKMAFLAARPFGCSVEINPSDRPILNMVWAVFMGAELLAFTLIAFVLLAATYSDWISILILDNASISLPIFIAFVAMFGWQCFKIIKYVFVNIGAEFDRD